MDFEENRVALRARFAVKLRFIEKTLMKKLSAKTVSGVGGRSFWGAFLVVAVIGGWMGWTEDARAQSSFPAPTMVKAKIGKVVSILQKTPEFQASTSEGKKDPKRREWLEVEVEFETSSDSKVGIIPELMMTFYVAVKGMTPQVLTGTFTYVNIVDGENNYAVVYVSPQGLTRIMGEPNKFRLGDVVKAGVEILYQGRVVAETPEAKALAAANAPKVTDALMAKEKTPFGLLWIDRHVELKPEK